MMKRILLTVFVVTVIGAAWALSGTRLPWNGLQFSLEERNPVTHLRMNQDEGEFQFAIVSDRTGSHRANVFSQAVEKLNLLQPEFVLSVGDLIEGGKKKPEQLQAEWKEFDSFVQRLTMPFFYVPGNHDVAAPETTKAWQEKLGRTYYHFLYRNVLFLILNNDDPPGSNGNISPEQIAYAQKALADNRNVRWTIVAMHRPLWTADNGSKNGWAEVEKALEGRPYTVFVGHVHRYQKFVRNGQNYYQLATTGGGSLLRGPEQGEFDHIVWVTMKKEGPVLANILLDSIHTENLEKIVTNEPVLSKRKPTYPVEGRAFFEGSPIPGAQVLLHAANEKGVPPKGSRAVGIVAADGTFKLTTYAAHDGVPEGEYVITVLWKQPAYDVQGKSGPNLLPARYSKAETSGLRVTIEPMANELILELRK
jgi:hypothetical protein